MRNPYDKKLEALFEAARRGQPDTTVLEAHFETRLMAKLAGKRNARPEPWHRMIWRMLPAFATIPAIVLAFNIVFSASGADDPFAGIANGHEEQLASVYFLGE
jgi:hypothetical protein